MLNAQNSQMTPHYIAQWWLWRWQSPQLWWRFWVLKGKQTLFSRVRAVCFNISGGLLKDILKDLPLFPLFWNSQMAQAATGGAADAVQFLSRVQLSATPWTAARQASLAITISGSLLKLMSIELLMPSNHLVLSCPLLLLPSIFPSIKVFSSDWLFASGGQSIGASASVLPMNIQDWFPLALTGLISWQSKGLKSLLQHHSS